MININKKDGGIMKKSCARATVFVSEFTNGILDPDTEMLGPVKDGGFIVANTAPGCWGPMITPAIRGGHEVTKPVFIEGAEVGDAIVIRIKSIEVTSQVTASGNERIIDGRFLGDPYVAGKCPSCDTLYPETNIEGIGEDAIRCAKCGVDVSPFVFTNGYTLAFDPNRKIGITLNKEGAEKAARDGRAYMAIPDNSKQNPVVTLAPANIVGAITRMKPFLGQLGTSPSIRMPDSHNAGDFGTFLINAPHEYGLIGEQLEARTDGHMDINRVREGAILICPVKIKGAGVYMGDVHAMQGDGEIAGHTSDVAAIISLQVHVLKGFAIEWPILLPVAEDLPCQAMPFSSMEKKIAIAEAAKWGVQELEESGPVSFVGTGANINEAIDIGIERAAKVLSMSVPEVKNRATITGGIQIGRAPGTVTVTLLAPMDKLRKAGIDELVREQYNL